MGEEFLRTLQVVCTTASVVILLTGVLLALRKRRQQQPVRGAAPALLFSAGVFCALFVASVPLAISEGHDLVSAAIVAVITTFQAVFFNRDFTGISRQILAITGSHTLLTNLMVLYFAFLHLVSPLLVIGVILSLLKDTTFRLRALFTRGKDIHAFSTLNERTLALAEDMAGTPGQRRMIIFTIPYSQARANRLEWVARAETIHALFLPVDITLLRAARKAPLHLYMMDDNPDQNLEQAIALVDRHRHRCNTALFVRSDRAADELILDSLDKGVLRVHLIHEPLMVVQRVLDRYPLLPEPGTQGIHLLVAGCGKTGYEMLKAACWCGQLPNQPLHIQVVDREADRSRDRFAFECPELQLPSPDSNLSVSFLQADIASKAFADLLAGSDPITHVFVALGDDERNLSTAVTIRRLLARQAVLSPDPHGPRAPVIVAHMESETREAIAETLSERRGGPMNIHAYGSIRDLYRHDNLVDNLLERLGLAVHLAYSGCLEASDDASRTDQDKATLAYWQQAYEHKSSLATALHLKYKMYALLGHLPGMDWANAPTADMVARYEKALKDSDSFGQQLQLEHARWNAYVRTEGYRVADAHATARYLKEVGHHKHDLARLHPCLVPWEDLSEVSEFVNRLQLETGIGGSHKDFARQDEQIVRIGPAMLRVALDGVRPLQAMGARKERKRRVKPDAALPDRTQAATPPTYQPSPVSTTDTMLSPDIVALAETLARNTHEVWSQGRMAEGWQYGPVRDDQLKTHPGLVPYDELSESEKDYDRQTSMETLRHITSLGFEISRKA